MATINLIRSITPADEARGLTVPDFAGALLFLGYTSGLWIRLDDRFVSPPPVGWTVIRLLA